MNIVVLLSGGVGMRMGSDIPKQYIRVSGKMLIIYCLETLLSHPLVDAVQIAAAQEWREVILGEVKANYLDAKKICGFSKPGTERQSSVFHALKDILDRTADIPGLPSFAGVNVIIHDAVRPNLSKEQITACLKALENHDGVMPVLPMKDTVYLSRDGRQVSKLLDREKVFAGQAPEAFVLGKYYEANRRLSPNDLGKIKGSAEPAVMAGMDIVMIPGDENNYKITTKADLEHFCIQQEQGR